MSRDFIRRSPGPPPCSSEVDRAPAPEEQGRGSWRMYYFFGGRFSCSHALRSEAGSAPPLTPPGLGWRLCLILLSG
jgi:hypothetical protein